MQKYATLILICLYILVSAQSAQASVTGRHNDAGIWAAYPSSLGPTDLSQDYIRGVMIYVKWRDIFDSNTSYNWTKLDSELNKIINTAKKKAFTDIPAGYCPNLDWPLVLKEHVASRKTPHSQGCYPLQFWDPLYKQYYSNYIYALANHLAQYDSTDINPQSTDISFVRAMVMAETMENAPGDSDINNGLWNYSQFNPAVDGHIYNVNLTIQLRDEYLKWVGSEYKAALESAYAKVNLPSPAVAAKATGYWDLDMAENYLISNNIWLWKTSGMPVPEGWYFNMVGNVKSGNTRGHTESGQHPRSPNIAQSTYWEILANLHSGIEFIGIYGNNRLEPTLQPKGPILFAENFEAIKFGNKYAGYHLAPDKSPGAWIALRGWYPENRFSELQHETIWSNYEMLMKQYRPQDSIVLYGTDDRSSSRKSSPLVERKVAQPWSDEESACISRFSQSECEHIKQQPDLYLGLNTANRYTYGYNKTDLGTVTYCGNNDFCDDAGNITRTETMLWARRTNGSQNNHYMRFDIDDKFAASLFGNATVRVVYLDRGSDKWQLIYDGGTVAGTITKTNSNRWKEANFTISGASLKNLGTGNTDIALYNFQDSDDIFHMIEVMRSSNQPPCPHKISGDADCDNLISLSDFEQWRKEYIGTTSSTNADFDTSGKTDLKDFETWRRNYLII